VIIVEFRAESIELHVALNVELRFATLAGACSTCIGWCI